MNFVVCRSARLTWGVARAPSPTHIVCAATGTVVPAGTDLGDADEPVGMGDRDTLDDPVVERIGIGGLTLDASVLVADLAELVAASVTTSVLGAIHLVERGECRRHVIDCVRKRHCPGDALPEGVDGLVADAVVDRLDGVDTRSKRIPLVGLDRGEVRVFGGLPCRRSSVRSDLLDVTGDRPDQFTAVARRKPTTLVVE